jgi:two-component system, response regulator FlrC
MRHQVPTRKHEEDARHEGHDRTELRTREPAMTDLLARARRAAVDGATVLIEAERGCDTGQLACFIHGASPFAARALVALHCGVLQGGLLESELFGRASGALTDVNRMIYLAEIGAMTPALQATLLRFLQEREQPRAGDAARSQGGVGVMASTHRDLEAAVRAGLFREDLYIRLHVLRIPPLRERKGDIPLLVERLCALDEREWGSFRVSAGALAALQAHAWPGNIRELESVVRRALFLANGPDLAAIDFFPEGALPASRGILLTRGPESSDGSTRAAERYRIEDALSRTRGNRTRAAAIVGISVRTLRNKLRAYRAMEGVGPI